MVLKRFASLDLIHPSSQARGHDNLSCLEFDKGIDDRTEIEESFSNEQLLAMEAHLPWYADFVNYWHAMCYPLSLVLN